MHTSYALQAGYEPLLSATGPATAHQLKAMQEHLLLAGDPRDLAAHDSSKHLLDLPPFDA